MKQKDLDTEIQKFIVSPVQLALDYKMVPYDIWATMAHVVMLYKTKILDKKTSGKILSALLAIEKEYKEGKYKIDPQKGAHLSLEDKIVVIAGYEAGLSTHTARSRNDQMMTAETLYLRNEVMDLIDKILKNAFILLDLSKRHINTIMPGYTHMQPAKPSTFSLWCLTYCDSFLRGIEVLQKTYQRYDLNPLGSVESYGTLWPIDRELTTKLLGFRKVWEIPQDAISNRGFFQLSILSSINEIALTASKLASDLLLFSTHEFGMIDLSEKAASRAHPITGSSVMPQKKNPDALELIRSTAPQVSAFYLAVSGILAGLPSGYNRDTREVKEYIDTGMKKLKASQAAIGKVLVQLVVNKKRMAQLVELNYCLTADLADYLSQKEKVPFRLVYRVVGDMVDDLIKNKKLLSSVTVEKINTYAEKHDVNFDITTDELKDILNPIRVLKRRHVGGTRPRKIKLIIKKRDRKIAKVKKWVNSQEKTAKEAKRETLNEATKIINANNDQ